MNALSFAWTLTESSKDPMHLETPSAWIMGLKKMNLLKAITGTDSQDYQNFNVCNGKK